MFDPGPHFGFIVASYLFTIAVLAGLITQTVARYKSVQKRLASAQIKEAESAQNG